MNDQRPGPIPVDQQDHATAYRAIEYHAEQLWTATAGLLTAYKVNSGDPGQVVPVRWEDLTDRQRLTFTLMIGPALPVLTDAIDHVMVCLRGEGRKGGHQ